MVAAQRNRVYALTARAHAGKTTALGFENAKYELRQERIGKRG